MFDDDQANAFALPGGKIGVYTGLLDVAENQDQLATVVAHEVAHVTRKHTLKALQKSMGMELAENRATYRVGSAFFDAVADKAAAAVLAGFGRAPER